MDRAVGNNGALILLEHRLKIGAELSGKRVTLRLDGHLIHVVHNGVLVKTPPSPIPADERDRDAVTSGQVTAGGPWQYYDLGHGYCTYSFFEQCPHRMACARCDFYTPKESSRAQLLEAKENLQRMLAGVPLTDDERAAVDEGQTALDQLLDRLADIPTPAGATPREIRTSATATLLPIVSVKPGQIHTTLTFQIPQNDRASRAEVPVSGHPIARPDRRRSGTMDHALETRGQRVRDHLRRPLAQRPNLLMEIAANTVSEALSHFRW